MIKMEPKQLDDSFLLNDLSSQSSDLSPDAQNLNLCDFLGNQLDEQEELKNEEFINDSNIRLETEEIQNRINIVNLEVHKTTRKSASYVNPLKVMVSKQKKRYTLDGFNLDLTYITTNIIALGFPAENYESFYRNSMQDVQRFFNNKHSDHYMIYNLCSERKYNPSSFNNQVQEFPFDDHQAPPFELIFEFCQSIHTFLQENQKNVVGIHCKAGKGRTGLMICCYLLFSNQFSTATDALRYYGMIRTSDKKGVTIPSQIRYVHYFEKALRAKWDIQQIQSILYEIVQIIIKPSPNFNVFGGCSKILINEIHINRSLVQNIKQRNSIYLNQSNCDKRIQKKIDDNIRIKQYLCAWGQLDSIFQFINAKQISQEKMFQAWFNCYVEQEQIELKKQQLDIACKDKENKFFDKDFSLIIKLEEFQQRKRSISIPLNFLKRQSKRGK